MSQPNLSPEQLYLLRQELQRSLDRLARSQNSHQGSASELDQSAIGRLSRIEALQNQGLKQTLQERERLQLEQVLKALERMDEGCYGLCADCRGPIRFERLLVFPEALNCAACGSGN